jgi:hypothetical protein
MLYRGLVTRDCTLVTLTRPSLSGLMCTNSAISASGGEIKGTDSRRMSGFLTPPGPGIGGHGSHIQTAGTDIRGGAGDSFVFGTRAGAPAVDIEKGTLIVAGDGATNVRAGACPGDNSDYPDMEVSAIRAIDTVVRIDPQVTVVSQNGAPTISGTSNVTRAALAWLSSGGWTRGMTAAAEIVSSPGSLYAVVLGAPLSVPANHEFGTWYVRLDAPTALWSGRQTSTGRTSLLIPIPLDARLRGRVFCMQSLNEIAGVAASPPLHVVVR